MEQNRRKTKLSRAQVRRLVIGAAIAAVVITAGAVYLRKRVTEQFGRGSTAEISSAEVISGSISTSVYGSGRLSDDDVEKLEIPSGVKLKEIRVSPGDKVDGGTLLASVNVNSVLAAMNDVSEQLSTLDSSISAAASSSGVSYISASVSGRIKKIYAAAGDSVSGVMYEHGALMLLSLDGYMAVDIDAPSLSAGDSVTVTGEGGASYAGTVDSVTGGTATVLVSDNSTAYGESVTVADENGSTLGSGALYIHDELKIMGYTGTVSYVSVSENSAVYSGSTLLSLSGGAESAGYDALLEQRAELEDELSQLIAIYREGGVYSGLSGTVKAVNAVDEDDEDSSSEDETDTEQYFSISPDETMSISVSVDESEILSVSVGQSAEVTIDSINGESFTGTVTEIDRAGTSSSGVTTYTAVISIEKTDTMLAGMSASATIKIDGVENALLIPVDALNRTSSGYYVYTECDEESGTLGGMVEVTAGISNSVYAEITSGLSEGDTVYYTEKEDNAFSFAMPGGDFGGAPGGGDFGGGNRGGGGPSGGPGGGGFPGGMG